MPIVIFGCLLLGWLAALSWLPGAACRKLAHLPNRRVDVEVSASRLVFQTATERLEVGWGELKELRGRGELVPAEFPLPRNSTC